MEENLAWLAENLGKKASEMPEEAIRRYLSAGFFKDHLQTYKKRPIYWLFSSGKEKAFECLVYLHRYNESTLSRMRNEYVIPLQGKYSGLAEHLSEEKDNATSASAQKKLEKQLTALKKKQAELAKFDEELKHYADMRISIDLDDGVKVNYGKFGKLLAEVKNVTGEK
jgi:type II restriction/modification system DNA methylase subunit YeeA